MIERRKDDFTERDYARLLDLAAASYRFVDIPEALDDSDPTPAVVWRHDVDYSPHRALSLARVEHAKGLRCVYHFMISSRYYNVLEPEISDLLRQISDLGHFLGLHVDMDVFGKSDVPSEVDIEARVLLERNVLEHCLDRPLTSFSFHNVVVNAGRLAEKTKLAGLDNASVAVKEKSMRYVSDSNGLWRYERLDAVLSEPPHRRLMVLTHPVWWTAESCSPYQCLERCVTGRAEANLAFYIDLLTRDGRLLPIAEASGLPKDLVERVTAATRRAAGE